VDLYRSTATKMFLGASPGEPDGIPIIDDSTDNDYLFPAFGKFGYDPDQYVPDMYAAPDGMDTYKESDYDALYDEQERAQSSLEHIYLRDWKGECLDQNGDGYCWDYGVTSAVMLRGLALKQPFVRLNGHAAAAIIKGGRDEGGWAGLAIKFIREFGQAEEGNGPGQWPTHSRDHRRFQDPAVKASMLKYRVTDDWYDLGKPAYAQEMKDRQRITCLFNNCPVPTDRMWWGHSTDDIRYVRIERGSWGYLTLNSWRGWGRRGLAVIRGTKARSDGSISVVASMAR
jgi:hypothetical protein